ncbi:hypothetical protein M441DRAFT_146680 [Trichoderma asperellum CBS 433.97]|uniref:AAA+ ATPase domain-containing protein n=1 Tax=Trichoderma asperellum (strain ATCC 204424 / CBS 433.97 / NBRC 101777) TaxID=1042311 RepID=A0A2T3Z0R6_TRIA4|nr:hypothetical protein M441DRAFT_146680 [Trichoderma asperellum CBS 433.97]PTB38395.1 hypothetical protein M441DRAFT_146680 [Trichoderma asperellum CBS 433.97]
MLPANQHDTSGASFNIVNAPSQPDSLAVFLHEKIRALQSENEALRRQEGKPVANFEVFHCILNQEGEETYLEKPYWAVTGDELQLKAHSLILYPDAYIRYKSPAFIVYRYYSRDKGMATDNAEALRQNKIPDPTPTNEVIRLVSEDMKRAMKAFIKKNENSKKKPPSVLLKQDMQSPYHWWYYYRNQPNIFDSLSQGQSELIRTLTNWIDANYNEIYSQVDKQFEHGMVSEISISFLIEPGDILIDKDEDCIEAYLAVSWLGNDKPNAVRDHLSKRSSSDSGNISQRKRSQQQWGVDVWSYKYDGKFYRAKKRLNIRLDTDTTNTEIPILDLRIFPLRFAPHELRESLEQRGKVFWSCRYRKYISYANKEKNRDHATGERYMIDYPTYRALHPGSGDKRFSTHESKAQLAFREQETPSYPDIYLLPRTILGFSLRRKKWEDLNVDLIQEVSWNKDAFNHLVADPETKELVQALVSNKVAAERGTDLMQNKGNGLIMLLHGGPGTGKTFTAESVAEIAEKPLYPVTCGDIGTNPEDVEKYLESVFHLGKIWGCVVLLDEAEVFLEQRSLNELARNALVSVFLRALEYYDGILILTTNRVGTFDEAFKSRIQLALHYEPLSQSQRAQIWRNFFRHLKALKEDNINYDDVESYIGELSEREMNGRQIRNVITTARQWAQFQGRTMAASHLKYAIKVTGKFDTYIKEVKEGFSDEQIARGDGVR